MSMGTTYANAALDLILGSGRDAAFPATVYAALYTAGGTELSGTGYARVSITNNDTNFPVASGGVKSNGTAITFPLASAAWGTAAKVKLMDASTAGAEVIGQELDTAKVIAAGSTPSFQIGDLEFAVPS